LKTIGPVYHYDIYTDAIQSEVMAYFQDVIFTPLDSKVTKMDATRHNSRESDALSAAIFAGVIWYDADVGAFFGQFDRHTSAALSAMEGAKYRMRSRAWQVARDKIPMGVRQSIELTRRTTSEKAAAALALLALIRSHAGDAETGINLIPAEKRILDAANDEFNRRLAEFGSERGAVGVPSDLKKVAEEIEIATRADAKRIMEEEAKRLADDIANLLRKNANPNDLKKTIENAKKRIAFRVRALSEHSAALLLSRFRYAQAKRLGISSYVWKTKLDNRVRHDHSLLEGKTFTWENPPVTNQETGARNNPGEDYNCRCVPLLKLPSFDLPS